MLASGRTASHDRSQFKTESSRMPVMMVTSFQRNLGTSYCRHTHFAVTNISRVLCVARPFPLAPRPCFTTTGIGIVNDGIMDKLSQLHCVFDIRRWILVPSCPRFVLLDGVHCLLSAVLISARESRWRRLEEFPRTCLVDDGAWRPLPETVPKGGA